MTDKVESETKDSEQANVNNELDDKENLDLGSKPQTPEEADASFSAGFKKGSNDPEAIGEISDAEKPAGEQQLGEERSTTDDDPEKVRPRSEADVLEAKSISKRMRRQDGMIGDLNEKITAALTKIDEMEKSTPGGETSSEADKKRVITLENLKEIEESIGEFKEFSPIKKELESIRGVVADLQNQIGNKESQDTEKPSLDVTEVANIVGQELLNSSYPNWQKDTQTEEFRKFMLDGGGPTEEEYASYAKHLNSQEIGEAKNLEQDWAEDYPEWWETKGEIIFSDKATDSIKVLDMYSASQDTTQERITNQETRQTRNESRLRSSATPKGTGAESPDTGLSDEEAFAKGFKKRGNQKF